MANQREVAELAGVSQSTVSLVLRGHPRIPEETRTAVMQAIEKLGYRPNPYVQALMTDRRRKTAGSSDFAPIALVTDYPAFRSEHLDQLDRGILESAESRGFGIERVSAKAFVSPSGIANLERRFRAIGLHGILLGPTRKQWSLPPLCWERYSVVGISHFFKTSQVHRTGSNHYKNVRLALERCAEQGNGRIGMATPAFNNRICDGAWTAAFFEFERSQYGKVSSSVFLYERGKMDVPALKKWYQALKPEVILVFNGKERNKIRKKLPEFQGTFVALQWDKPMGAASPGIEVRAEELGKAAVSELISKLQRAEFGLAKIPTTLELTGEWYPGAWAKNEKERS